MIVIYHCYGGAHSSVVAAAIHLGLLPEKVAASPERLWSVPYYDKQDRNSHGRIEIMGRDARGHLVCVLGRRNCLQVIQSAVVGIGGALGAGPTDVVCVDTLHCVNQKMRIGGFLSRFLGLKAIGRPLVIRGTIRAYHRLADLACRTRESLP